jgi:hypothetical protein
MLGECNEFDELTIRLVEDNPRAEYVFSCRTVSANIVTLVSMMFCYLWMASTLEGVITPETRSPYHVSETFCPLYSEWFFLYESWVDFINI